MSSYPPYKNVLAPKSNYDNQSEIITLDIENIVLIAYTISRVEGCPDIGKACPTAFPSLRVPIFQSFLRLWMIEVIVNQCLFCYDIHIRGVS